jgi:hypothetical protein
MIDPSDSFFFFGISVVLLTAFLSIFLGLTTFSNSKDFNILLPFVFLYSFLVFLLIYVAISLMFAFLAYAFGSVVMFIVFLSQLNTERILIAKKSDQISASVYNRIHTIKSRIKDFKEKGIKTAELQLILDKTAKEIARTVQSPSTALVLEMNANNKKVITSCVIFVAYNCYILLVLVI